MNDSALYMPLSEHQTPTDKRSAASLVTLLLYLKYSDPSSKMHPPLREPDYKSVNDGLAGDISEH